MQQDSQSDQRSSVGSPDHHARGLLPNQPNALRYREDISPDRDASDTGGMLRELVPDNSRLLDIGCGTGTLAEYVSRDRNVEVLGVEPDLQRAELARQHGFEVIHGLANHETLRDAGRFDVVMFADVLEHVAAPAELIEFATTMLKPGGRIIASIPNIAHWTVRTSLMRGQFEYQETGIMDATHLRWFTRTSVQDLFERCGLEIVSLRATAGTWMPVYDSFPWKLAPRRMRLGAIRGLSRRLPSLFGCQHIVEARLPTA